MYQLDEYNEEYFDSLENLQSELTDVLTNYNQLSDSYTELETINSDLQNQNEEFQTT